MHTANRTLPFLALTLLGACAPSDRAEETETSAQNARRASSVQRFTVPDTLNEWIAREMERRRIPGLALAIARAGEVLVSRGYGVADVQNQVPMSIDTRFELASLTKAFTAAGILLLVEDGKLDLDAPISQYLTDAPAHWNGITTRHLLNHTSGLPGMGQAFRSRDTPWPIYMRTELLYEVARGDTLSARPGEQHVYSDVGYFLLGVITEKVSGMLWRDFIAKRILEPLGMSDSYIMDLDRIHRNEARGYTIENGELVNIRRVHQVETPSHIGLFSNLSDLVKWDAALYTNKLLSEASLTEMWTPAKLSGGGVHTYGLGWNVSCKQGHPVQEHTGLTGTEIVRLPGDTLTVIVLTNLGGPSPEVDSWGIATSIAEMMVPTLAPKSTAQPLPEAESDRLAGSYRHVSGFIPGDTTVRIAVDNERVYLHLGSDSMRLLYSGGDRYAAEGEPVEIVVERNDSGRVEAWRVHGVHSAPASGAVRSLADCAVEAQAVGPVLARAVRQ